MPYAPTRRHARAALIVGLALLVTVIFTSGLGVAVYTTAYYAQHGAIPFVATPLPTATPESLPALQDSLTSNIYGWDVAKPYCQFADGGYEVSNAICFAPAGGEVRDGSVSIQARQVAGPTLDGYGIVLRFASKGNYYAFNVAGNGDWVFFKVVNDTSISIDDWTRSEAIRRGTGATNTLLVQFGHSHFDLFVNGVKVGQANDWAFAGGYIGLESYMDMHVVFNNIAIMTYP
jgi:hypothetical protein